MCSDLFFREGLPRLVIVAAHLGVREHLVGGCRITASFFLVAGGRLGVRLGVVGKNGSPWWCVAQVAVQQLYSDALGG